ncbi:MAG TPA: hypothetical protein VIE37_14990 [Methylomirabilota bacterium]
MMCREERTRQTGSVQTFHGVVGLALVGVLFAVGPHVGYSADRPHAPALVVELNGYADLVGRTLLPAELARLTTASSSSRLEIQALRAALLYRADPVRYRAALSSQFAVHDYAPRSKGLTEDISQEEFILKIKQIEQAYPSLHPTFVLLVSFVQFRDANLWFSQGSQKLSVSRFVRGAFFAHAFKGSTLDAVSVASALDQEARLQYERDAASKR